MQLWKERMASKNERSGREDAKRKKIHEKAGCWAKDEMDARGSSFISPLTGESRNLWEDER